MIKIFKRQYLGSRVAILLVLTTVFGIIFLIVTESREKLDFLKKRMDFLEVSLVSLRKTERVLGETSLAKEEEKHQRKKVYEETSPNGERRIVLYELPFVGEGDLDYRNYLSNQYIFSVESYSDGGEYHVFINDYKTGYPHWLGNSYIFFTSGCGTGCRGLYLVNVDSKVSHQAVLFTNPLPGDESESIFSDWFGQEFRFHGSVKNIRGTFLDGRAYLVFQLWNNDEPLSEKRFLFTEKSLEAL